MRARRIRSQLAEQVRKLSSREICILSNNCVAGILYELADLPKQTPTVGLYFSRTAYGRFLDDVGAGRAERWIDFDESDLVFRKDQNCWALERDGGQIVFLHYRDAGEAIAKWRRRMRRLEGKTPLVISCMQNGTTLNSLLAPLRRFRFSFTVDGNPTLPADEIMLDSSFLDLLSSYLAKVLQQESAEAVAPEVYLYRFRDYLAQDPHSDS